MTNPEHDFCLPPVPRRAASTSMRRGPGRADSGDIDMRKTAHIFTTALALAALAAVPAVADGISAAVVGTVKNASDVTIRSESTGAPSAAFSEHLLTVRAGSRDVLLRFIGEVLPGGGVRVDNPDGPVFLSVGDRVRVRAVFTCLRPGGLDGCNLLAVRVTPR